MTPEELHKQLLPLKEKFREALNTERGSWFLKEYNIASDISVTSNIIEGILSWVMLDFASQYDYRVVMKDYVSIYPYMSLIVGDGSIFAVDFRSAYRTNESTIDGFPLGSFTGYFRQRQSRKLITFPYSDYAGHFVICAISSPRPDNATIESIIDDFDVVIQEKWRIASDSSWKQGTNHIGSIKKIDALLAGNGIFKSYGKKVFDDYWMNYLTKDMARAIDSSAPYRNLEDYLIWRNNLRN